MRLEDGGVDEVTPIVSGRDQDEGKILEFGGDCRRQVRVREAIGDLETDRETDRNIRQSVDPLRQ